VTDQQAEFQAFVKSGYSWDDASKLAWFWQVDVGEAKLRIGRKMKWGDSKILRNMLYNAQGQYIWILKSPYTAQDAEALADFWGTTVELAKISGGHKLEGWLSLNLNLAAAWEARGGQADDDAPPIWHTYYTVVAGDNLTKIAARYSTADFPITAAMLAEANSDQVADPNLIYPGQVLVVPDAV